VRRPTNGLRLARRFLNAAGAGVSAAITIAIGYAVVDLYLAGHSVAVPIVAGRPLHALAAELLVFVVPLATAAIVFSRGPVASFRPGADDEPGT
jgi:hypothetical protein